MEKYIIRLLNPQQRDYLMGTINYKPSPPDHADEWAKKHAGRTFHITQDFRVYEAKSQKEDDPAWSLRMDERRMEFFIEFDSTSDLAHHKNRALACKHLCYQAKMRPLSGEKNTNAIGEPFFTIECEGLKNTNDADLIDKKAKVYEKFRAYTPSEKRDCAFYYNVNASNLKHSELIVKMIHFENGRLMNPNGLQDGMNIMDHFIQMYGQEHITLVKMIAEKSLVYGQITRDAKGLYIGKEFIGTSVETVYDYLKANKQVQQFLAQQVANIDRTVEDDMDERPQTEFKEAANIDEVKKWRTLGSKAKVKMANVCGIETIKERMRELAVRKKLVDLIPQGGSFDEYEILANALVDKNAGVVTA